MKDVPGWIFSGKYRKISYKQYVVAMNLVGPMRPTLYQECKMILNRMDNDIRDAQQTREKTRKILQAVCERHDLTGE